MASKLIGTDDDVVGLVLRVMLALGFFPHGAQEVFGWFGGPGFTAAMDAFVNKAGFPAALAFLAIMAESAGSVALTMGVAVNMIVCAYGNHIKNGFFMNSLCCCRSIQQLA